MENSKSVAVLGGGSFGTVLANLAASNGYEVFTNSPRGYTQPEYPI